MDGREGGAIWLHRQIMSSAVWSMTGDQFKTFAGLLMSANWRDSTVLIQGKPRVIRRGQVLLSQRHFADHCMVSRGVVERTLATLKALGMVETEQAYPGQRSSHNPTIVTIVNYERYQHIDRDERAKEQAADEPRTGHEQGRSEEGKKGRKNLSGDESPGLFPSADQQITADEGEGKATGRADNAAPPPTSKPKKPSPQGEAFTYWKENVWWRLSTVPCPKATAPEMVQLAARCREYGVAGVTAAMDRVVAILEGKGADSVWLTENLTLLTFATTQFPKFLPRAAGAAPVPARNLLT